MEKQVDILKELASSMMAGLRKECAKKNGVSKSWPPEPVQEAASEGLNRLLEVRKEIRDTCLEVERLRSVTADARMQLEASDLALQNLIYEHEYYAKQIKSNLEFKSQYTDEQIGLIPEEQFRKEAPPKFLEGIEDPHKLMLQRLSYEVETRKALQQEAAGLQTKRAAAQEAAGDKRKVLDDIQAQLKTLATTVVPLQSVLEVKGPLASLSNAANALPSPLYVAYSQLVAADEAASLNITVSIAGSPAAAAAFETQLTAEKAMSSGSEPPKKRSKRSEKAAENHGITTYTPHPLSVVLTILDPAGAKGTLMEIRLIWLPLLGIVAAEADSRGAQQLLGTLFPGDDGVSSPNEANLHRDATFAYDVTQTARPYRWCQHLAGLDFLPAAPPAAAEAAAKPGEAAAKSAEAAAKLSEGLATHRRQRRAALVVEQLRRLHTAAAALK